MGFMQTVSDPCLYIASEGELFIIGVYVDDIMLAGKSDRRLVEVKKALSKQFKLKDMGELYYFLGMKIIQNHKSGEVWNGQPAYTNSVLQKFGMENAKTVNTPVETGTKLMNKKVNDDEADQELQCIPVSSWQFAVLAHRYETRHHL